MHPRFLNLKSETGGDEGAGRHDHSGQDVAAGIAEGAATGFEKDAARFAAVVPSPSHQVAGRVVAAALAAQPETEATGLASTKAASTSVIKVLRLELQPADLGTITIRLSLKRGFAGDPPGSRPARHGRHAAAGPGHSRQGSELGRLSCRRPVDLGGRRRQQHRAGRAHRHLPAVVCGRPMDGGATRLQILRRSPERIARSCRHSPWKAE